MNVPYEVLHDSLTLNELKEKLSEAKSILDDITRSNESFCNNWKLLDHFDDVYLYCHLGDVRCKICQELTRLEELQSFYCGE